jgi:hypothetical protein
MCFYIYAMTSDVYCNPVFVIERRQTFTVIKLHHWIAHAETMYPIKKHVRCHSINIKAHTFPRLRFYYTTMMIVIYNMAHTRM